MASIWGMMMGIALSGEGNSDFSDGGTVPTAQKQEKQKVCGNLCKGRKKHNLPPKNPLEQQPFLTLHCLILMSWTLRPCSGCRSCSTKYVRRGNE